jgi:hypothetical protein
LNPGSKDPRFQHILRLNHEDPQDPKILRSRKSCS